MHIGISGSSMQFPLSGPETPILQDGLWRSDSALVMNVVMMGVEHGSVNRTTIDHPRSPDFPRVSPLESYTDLFFFGFFHG